MAGKTKAGARQTAVLKRQTAFLAVFAICGSVKDAGRAAGVKRGRHYEWLKSDEDYGVRFRAAREMAVGALEDEVVERAMRGVFEPNVYQGRFVYPQEEYVVKPAVTDKRGRVIEPEVRASRDVPGALPFGIWRKSDALLIFLLRGLCPEKYGWRGAVEVTGPQGDPIEIVRRLNAGMARVAAAAKNDRANTPVELVN